MLAEEYEKKIREVKNELEKYLKNKFLKVEKDLEKIDKLVKFNVDRLLFDAMNHETKILIDCKDETQLLTILKPLVSKQMADLFDRLIKLNTIESKNKNTVTDSSKSLMK